MSSGHEGNWPDRAFPALIAVAVAAVLWFSEVPPNLWVMSGTAATLLSGAYIAPNLYLTVRPDDIRAHYLAGALAVFVWGGRAGGFLELVLSQPPRLDLIGAVIERSVILAGVLIWHIGGGVPTKRAR